MTFSAPSLVPLPESMSEIRTAAEDLLFRADAARVFPTPVDKILSTTGISDIGDIEEIRWRYLKSLPPAEAGIFEKAWKKVQGFADLQNGSIYSAPAEHTPLWNWLRLHELGHHVLWWHRVRNVDGASLPLTAGLRHLFDKEADAFASQIVFQGSHFDALAGALPFGFGSILRLAEIYGAPQDAAARRLVEDCRNPAALVTYVQVLPSVGSDAILELDGDHSGSPSFGFRCAEVQLPTQLPTVHPWQAALQPAGVRSGKVVLNVAAGTPQEFVWETWWNGSQLFVLLRGLSPALRLVDGVYAIVA